MTRQIATIIRGIKRDSPTLHTLQGINSSLQILNLKRPTIANFKL